MAQGAGLNFIKHTSIQLGPAARLTSPGEEPWPGGFACGASTGGGKRFQAAPQWSLLSREGSRCVK